MIVENIESDFQITLDEFCAICDKIGEFDSASKLKMAAKPLIELANNTTLIIDFLNDELKDIDSFQEGVGCNMQSLIIASRKHYKVRVNFWPTSNEFNFGSDTLNKIFAYELPHDHNFSFLTTGFTARGYDTDIYTYEYDRYENGDNVELQYFGQFELKKGTVMIYEGGKDIHIQHCPSELAISINLIPNNASEDFQYLFDIENKKVQSILLDGSTLHKLECISADICEGSFMEALKNKYGDARRSSG